MDDNDVQYDVIVVGGGAAGLSGALLLVPCPLAGPGARRRLPAQRAGRSGVHNWLTRDGLPPAEIGRIGRAEVTGYGGVVRDARVTAARTTAGRRRRDDRGRDEVTARRLLVTTGLTDEIPPIDGLTERWGSDVFGCPFCHAWEHRDTRIGVLSTGPHDLMKAHIASRWSDDVTLFLHTGPEPDDEQWAGFAACGISVVDGEVTGTVVADGRLAGLRLASGTVVPVDALTISPRAVARAGFLAGLGLDPVEHPSGLGAAVPAGPDGRTSVPGVWVAGNVADPMATVPAAVAAGSRGGRRDRPGPDHGRRRRGPTRAAAAPDPFSRGLGGRVRGAGRRGPGARRSVPVTRASGSEQAAAPGPPTGAPPPAAWPARASGPPRRARRRAGRPAAPRPGVRYSGTDIAGRPVMLASCVYGTGPRFRSTSESTTFVRPSSPATRPASSARATRAPAPGWPARRSATAGGPASG